MMGSKLTRLSATSYQRDNSERFGCLLRIHSVGPSDQRSRPRSSQGGHEMEMGVTRHCSGCTVGGALVARWVLIKKQRAQPFPPSEQACDARRGVRSRFSSLGASAKLLLFLSLILLRNIEPFGPADNTMAVINAQPGAVRMRGPPERCTGEAISSNVVVQSPERSPCGLQHQMNSACQDHSRR